MTWKDLLAGLRRGWVALGRIAHGQSLHVWEGKMEMTGAGVF